MKFEIFALTAELTAAKFEVMKWMEFMGAILSSLLIDLVSIGFVSFRLLLVLLLLRACILI